MWTEILTIRLWEEETSKTEDSWRRGYSGKQIKEAFEIFPISRDTRVEQGREDRLRSSNSLDSLVGTAVGRDTKLNPIAAQSRTYDRDHLYEKPDTYKPMIDQIEPPRIPFSPSNDLLETLESRPWSFSRHKCPLWTAIKTLKRAVHRV